MLILRNMDVAFLKRARNVSNFVFDLNQWLKQKRKMQALKFELLWMAWTSFSLHLYISVMFCPFTMSKVLVPVISCWYGWFVERDTLTFRIQHFLCSSKKLCDLSGWCDCSPPLTLLCYSAAFQCLVLLWPRLFQIKGWARAYGTSSHPKKNEAQR